jgi:serine/threonine protein kinase
VTAAPGDLAREARDALSAGDFARATELFERACDFGAAAAAALAGGELARAVFLAVLGGESDVLTRATARLVAERPRGEVLRVASDLAARGFERVAGQLSVAVGELREGAAWLARGGDALAAADAFERAGRPADAARTLEAALRRDERAHGARLRLGQLLIAHGRDEGAVRALQAIPEDAPEFTAALPWLADALERLELPVAARGARETMERLGIARAPASSSAQVEPARPAQRLLFGRYEIVREVAVTPNARLFEAEDRVQGGRVAVKVLAPSVGAVGRDVALRFEREAQALARVRHPSVLPLLAYVPEGPAIVLPWMPGGSLADRLRSERLTPARAAEIAAAVLSAAGEAHRLGILHRDIKPANVLFDGAGAARLADFGAAHLGDLSRTATAGAIGTVSYMAPEQREGRPATVTTDVYAVGALLLEMLTGAPPAASGGPARAPSASHRELDVRHDRLLAELLASETSARPPSAFEARRRLLALPWPDHTDGAAPVRAPSTRPAAPSAALAERLREPSPADADGRFVAYDTWTFRAVCVIPLAPGELERARIFARVSHPSLPVVLRLDGASESVWVAEPPSELAPSSRLDGPAARALALALETLHAAGGAHGAVDAAHVRWAAGGPVLAYPRGPSDGARERDAQALAELAAGRMPAPSGLA